MKQANTSNSNRALAAWAGMAALAVAALGFAGSAQARDGVFWSVGVASPGVSIGMTNNRPVYVSPAPVYVMPSPAYVQPAPVYLQQSPLFISPQVVYVQPGQVYQPGWAPPGRAYGWHHHHRDHFDRDGHQDRHGWRDQAPRPYAYNPGYGQPSDWRR